MSTASPDTVIARGRRPRGKPARRHAALACFAALLCTAMMAVASPALARNRPSEGFEATLPVSTVARPGFDTIGPNPARPATGGIFQASTGYAALHEGTRARGVGDPLTILLVESTTTAKSVSSKSKKNGNLSLTPPVTGPFSFLSPDALKTSSDSSFNGSGNAGQTSSISSTLSVTIADVRSNGTALVKGEKRMLLSQGREWIQFSGIVRLADIDIENSVLSTRVADARIEYSGKGALQRSSRQGWLGRFFNMISPF